jgi:hypothetical protein
MKPIFNLAFNKKGVMYATQLMRRRQYSRATSPIRLATVLAELVEALAAYHQPNDQLRANGWRRYLEVRRLG